MTATGLESQDRQELLLGWDRREITPQAPVALAGFAARAEMPPADGVVSPIHLRTVALRQGDRTAVIIVGDVLCWGPDNMARIEREAADRFGLAPEQLIISATHTHSAPQPSSWFTPGLGVADPVWVEFLHTELVAGIDRAMASLVPVSLEVAQGPFELGVERRSVRSAGKERPAPLPQRLTVINFRSADRLVASLFHHACHPVLHHGNAVSADFPGEAMASLERPGSDGSEGAQISVFLQGCCGNVNPDRYEGTKFRGGDLADLQTMGHGLADAVRTLSAAAAPVTADLAMAQRIVEVPTEPAPSADELADLADTGSMMTQGWSRLLLEHPDRREGASVTVSRLRLGDDLQLLGLSGEPTSPYGNHVTEALGPRALTLGYCNGMLGYLVSAEQLADGGYEAHDAPCWFGMPGPLTAEAEAVLRTALLTVGSSGHWHSGSADTGANPSISPSAEPCLALDPVTRSSH